MIPDPLRVLIVEDDDDDAELIRIALTRGGFTPIALRVDTEASLREAMTSDWDVVLSDFEMPAFDGLRAFDVVHGVRPLLPFIFVSGALGEDRAVAAMRAGPRDYLLKDQLHRLAVTVRRELEASEERRARRAADEATSQHQRRLEMAIEASGMGIFEQTEGEVYLSEHWRTQLGIDGSTLVAQRFPAWLIGRLHTDDILPFRNAYAAWVAGDGDRVLGEFRLRRPDGDWVFVLVTLKSVGPGHIVGVLEDLTPRHRLEAELRQAQKMEAVGRLAGGIAHDFNNLLTAILGFAELMGQDESLPPALGADLAEIMRAARRAEDLTSQLLAFSRRRSIAPRVLDLNEVIRAAGRLLHRLVGPNVTLRLDLCPQPRAVRIDPGGFEQVLMNLAVNARDAMPGGGSLTITTLNVERVPEPGDLRTNPNHRGHLQIVVADTGVGMDEATLRHVFEPFFTTKEAGKGTGLGLSTCYGIVQQAGGSIAVDSGLGVGTRVVLRLPAVAEATDAAVAPRGSALGRARGERILLVEDDAAVARLVSRSLTRLGFEVLHAEHAEAALAIEHSMAAPLDLLLTDVLLPGIDGVALAAALGQRRPGLRVLYMTAFSEHTHLRRDARVLPKPFSLEALNEAVLAAIADPTQP